MWLLLHGRVIDLVSCFMVHLSQLQELLVSTRRNLQQQIQELQNEVAALNAQVS